MTKHISLLVALATALVLGSCHSSSETVVEKPVSILDRFDTEGNAYMQLSINIDNNFTRSANGVYDEDKDAEAAETAINNALLLLFHGKTTEDGAKLCSYYWMAKGATGTVQELPTFNKETYHDGILEKTDAFIQKIKRDNIEPDDNVYCLLVLNHNNLLGATTLDSWIENEETFENIKKHTLNSIGDATDTDKGLLMSNAPMAPARGGSTEPTGPTTTLVKIAPQNIYTTEREALANPAANIFVERAAVKIEVKCTATEVHNNKSLTFDPKEDVFVALDRYNTSYRLVRNFDDNWLSYANDKANKADKYRMVDANLLLGGANAYRTYWGEDNDYSNDNGTDDLKNYTDFEAIGEKTTYYCAENTMAHDKQKLQNTTSLVIRLKVFNGDFYTVSIEGSLVYTPDEEENTEDGTSADQSLAPRRAGESEADKIRQYIVDWLVKRPEVNTWLTDNNGNESWLEVTIAKDADAKGRHQVTVATASHVPDAAKTPFEALNLNNELAKYVTVKGYTGGYCYYRVPIKHFGDELTPWTTYKETDNYTANDHLGRYGVLRNNWYDITITEVNRIGEPTVPPADDTWDDAETEALSLKVNIMPWLYQDIDITY